MVDYVRAIFGELLEGPSEEMVQSADKYSDSAEIFVAMIDNLLDQADDQP